MKFGFALANSWNRNKHQTSGWFMSEKLDGVRVIWDGKNFYTRGGNLVNCPPWFSAGLPNVFIDGEMWAGRGRFNFGSGVCRKKEWVFEDWNQMEFKAFDLPKHGGTFKDRIEALDEIYEKDGDGCWDVVDHHGVHCNKDIDEMLNYVVSEGGEGLILRDPDAYYGGKRRDTILKVKKTYRQEYRVTGYIDGKGRLDGMLGALEVETEDGTKFGVGAGLSDDLRCNPEMDFPVGCLVTVEYFEKGESGVPRFPVFIERRWDLENQDKNNQDMNTAILNASLKYKEHEGELCRNKQAVLDTMHTIDVESLEEKMILHEANIDQLDHEINGLRLAHKAVADKLDQALEERLRAKSNRNYDAHRLARLKEKDEVQDA
jgi:DNA ligase-1